MAFDPAKFKKLFSEFNYSGLPVVPPSDEDLRLWATIAEALNDPERFGPLFDYAVYLYVAHLLTMSFDNQVSSSGGAIPGKTGGMITTRAVGEVSLSYDVPSLGAGITDELGLNLTTYGRRWLNLAHRVGGGGLCVPSQ